MNPDQVPSRDWGLYYNNTYMIHDEHGVVRVQANRSDGLHFRTGSSRPWTTCRPQHLTCVWPNARAINVDNGAIYVGRRALREARRSATLNHYFSMWTDSVEMGHTVMKRLCFPPEYPSLAFAIEALQVGGYTSIAVSRDLILARVTRDRFRMICLGTAAAHVEPMPDGRLRVLDEDAVTATDKRALYKLEKEGWLWH